MSVLIKDMSIPDNCDSCAFETGFGFCLAKSNNYCGYTNARKRPKWCSLVEVAEPHGRLISADIFNEFIEKHCADDLADLLKELVRRQPTVIEAEGE